MIRKFLALTILIAVLSGSTAIAQLVFSGGLRFDYVHDNHPDRAPLLATDLGGIYMSGVPTISGNTLTINYQDADGDPASLDFTVTGMGVDTHLSTAAWDPATRVLTLTLSDGTTEPVTLTGLLSSVSTQAPVSGDGTSSDPVTIAANAITRDSLSSDITTTLDRADNVPFALTYRINESATAVDGQSTYWIGNIYEAHLAMTVHAFQVETLVPTGQDRTYRGTLVPLTQVSATSYTADSNPLQVVIREPGRTFGTQAVITGNGTQRTLEVQASGREFHVNEGGYFFLGVGISNAIDATYVLAASGSTEEDHADHTGFSFDVMTYAAKGSNNEGSRTQLSGTEFFNNTTTAIRMEVHYDAAPGGLQDGVSITAICTGDDLVIGRSQGLANLTAPGACQAGGGSTVTTSAPVSGDGSAGNPVTIADGAIDADALATDSVNTAEIVGSAVRNSELANNAVSSAKIADGAVTLGKIGDGAVATNQIVDDSVTNAKMADDSVGTANIIDLAVTVNKLSSGTAADGFVATANGSGGVAFEASTGGGGGGTVSTSTPVSGDGSSGDPVTIVDGAIDNDAIANAAVNTAQLADGAVTEPKLAAEVRELIRGATSTGVVTYAIDDDVDTTTDRSLAQYSGNIYRALEDLVVYRYRFTIDRPSGTSSRYSGHAFQVTRNGDHDYRPVSGADLSGLPTRSVTNNGVFIEPRLSTDFPNVGADPDELEVRVNNGLHIESGQYFTLIVNVHDDQNNRPYVYSSENINPVQVAHIGNGDFPHESIDFNHPVRANPIQAGQSVAEAGGSDWVISMQVDYAIAGGALLSAQDEGTQVYTGPTLINCTGAGVTCSEDTTNDLLLIDVPGGGGGGGTVSTSAPVSGDGSSGDPVTIADDAIGNDQLADDAVDTDQIATDAVTSAKIADRSVNSARIAIAGVTGTNIATNSITTSHISNSTITSVDLANDAVTQAKIADNAIDAARIENNAVGSSEIANNAVTSSEIADNAVGSGEIANGGVATVDIADNAVTQAKLADDAVGTDQVLDDAIVRAKIADNAVGSAQIASGSVGPSELADDSVETDKIAAGAVTNDKIGSGTAADGFALTADGSGNTAWEATTGAEVDLQNVATNILPDADNSHVVGSESRTFSDGHFEILEVDGVLDVGDLRINNDLIEEVIEDAIAEDLVEGTGISIVRNDAADTITISATGVGEFSGALVDRTSDLSTNGTLASVDWQVEEYDEGGWWTAGNADDFTVPADIERVIVACHLQFNGVENAGQAVVEIRKGGVHVEGLGRASDLVASPASTINLTATSAVLEVDSGDTFQCYKQSTDSTIEIDTNSWFAIYEVQGGGGGGTGTVSTSEPVSGSGLSGDPITIADGDIDSDAIADDAVINAKIADNAVGSRALTTDAVANVNIADDAVDTEELADGAVDVDRIANRAVTAAKMNSGTAASGQVLASDGSGGADYQTAIQQVRDDLPAPTSACERQLTYDANTHDVEICVNTPHQQVAATGTWDFIPTRTDLLVEESRAFVDSPDLNDYVFDAGAHHFYQWSIVFQSGTTRNAWVQTIATNALAASRSNNSYSVRFLGEQNSDADALALVHTLTANTDYFYVAGDSIRTLDLSSYVAAGDTIDHWEWRPVVDDRRRVTTLFEDVTVATMLTDNVPRTVVLSQAPNSACDLTFRVERGVGRLEILPRVFSSDWLGLSVVTSFPAEGSHVVNAMIFKFAGRGLDHSEFSHATMYVWRSSSASTSLAYSFGQHGNEVGNHHMLIREICY